MFPAARAKGGSRARAGVFRGDGGRGGCFPARCRRSGRDWSPPGPGCRAGRRHAADAAGCPAAFPETRACRHHKDAAARQRGCRGRRSLSLRGPLSRVSPQNQSKADPSVASSSSLWIRTLAAPYPRGYSAVPETRGGLRGNRFLASGANLARERRGFFVGYIVEGANHQYLQPQPPECVVFASVEPVGSATYRHLVTQKRIAAAPNGGVGWLRHRPPRFALFEKRDTVLIRHLSMREWPPEKYQHFSGNFFIETLAWLVRSGLVKKLCEASGNARKKSS